MRINTYSQVWGIKRVFYHIQKLKLPFPVSLPEMGIFIFVEILGILVFRRFPIPAVFKFLLIPVGITWALSRMELEERPPHYFLYSIIRYIGRPHISSKGRPIARVRKVKTNYTSRIEWDGPSDRIRDSDRDTR